jgi:hypothetical protein
MCFTYAAILLLFAIYPQAPIATFIEPGAAEAQGWGIKFLGYSFIGTEHPLDVANRVIVVSSGHLVFANSYVLTFILSAYFMPVGRR